jgi:hypothetical protein
MIGQVFVEPVEALFPEVAVLRDPVRGRAERFRIEPAVMNTPFASPLEEPGFFENSHVPRNGGKRDVERLREIGHADLAERQAGEDGPSRGIGQRRECPVE